ncbi:hypothetical protein CKAH01_03045 [Colletotrichum kahawae]|uniref:Uncharacterized protein n=1 Tax=Colletotrichum kahawae TaxID=34407 RepID=A0AAD9YWN7_COLKA|nr:hypothetical protein CKAH01_03045 [Colletotrichum kahawae]
MRIGASPLRTSHPNPSDATLLFLFQQRLYLAHCFRPCALVTLLSLDVVLLSNPAIILPFMPCRFACLFSNLALTTS